MQNNIELMYDNNILKKGRKTDRQNPRVQEKKEIKTENLIPCDQNSVII